MRPRERLNRDGLPVDKMDWTYADWQTLHEAVERTKRIIAQRHKVETPPVDERAEESDL